MCGMKSLTERKSENLRRKGALGCVLTWYVTPMPDMLCNSSCTYLAQSVDGSFTASGHENGAIYVFNNDTGRLLHSLPSKIGHRAFLDLPLKRLTST